MMEKETTKKKMGRPKKEVDWDLFKSLCELHCTAVEIAHVLDINQNVLEDKIKEKFGESFRPTREKLSAGGKVSLRRAQFRLASRNAAMAIWLGKNYLDQKDTIVINDVSDDIESKYSEMIQQLKILQDSASAQSDQLANLEA